jgi:membrane protease YdiL (CAAX protease family)
MKTLRKVLSTLFFAFAGMLLLALFTLCAMWLQLQHLHLMTVIFIAIVVVFLVLFGLGTWIAPKECRLAMTGITLVVVSGLACFAALSFGLILASPQAMEATFHGRPVSIVAGPVWFSGVLAAAVAWLGVSMLKRLPVEP